MYQASMELRGKNDAFGVKQSLSPSSLKDCCVNYKAAILLQLIHRHKTNARSYKHNTLAAIFHVNVAQAPRFLSPSVLDKTTGVSGRGLYEWDVLPVTQSQLIEGNTKH